MLATSNAYIEIGGNPHPRPSPIAQTDTLSGFGLLYTPFTAPQDNGKRHLRTGTIRFSHLTHFFPLYWNYVPTDKLCTGTKTPCLWETSRNVANLGNIWARATIRGTSLMTDGAAPWEPPTQCHWESDVYFTTNFRLNTTPSPRKRSVCRGLSSQCSSKVGCWVLSQVLRHRAPPSEGPHKGYCRCYPYPYRTSFMSWEDALWHVVSGSTGYVLVSSAALYQVFIKYGRLASRTTAP